MELEDAWDAALEMVDMAQWRTRARIVSMIRRLQRRSEDGWARVSYITVARRLGISERYAWDLLGSNGSMWKTERVLERGRVGAGQRGTEFRVREPSAWRVVPWKELDRDRRADRLAAVFRAPDRGANEGADGPSSYVPCRGASRSSSAITYRGEHPAGSAMQDRGARSRTGSASSAMQDRGANRARRAPSPFAHGAADAASSVEEEEEQGVASQRIIKAIEAKTRLLCDGPSLVARIDRLAARHDVELLVAAVDSAPAEYKPPYVVKHIEAVASGRITLLPSGGAPPLDELRKRAEVLTGLIGVYQDAGDDPPPGLMDELTECQNRLRASEEMA